MNNSETISLTALERYYHLHARIYDSTRWSFLFGRRALVRALARHCQPQRILEVGCGTGYNLQLLQQQFPDAELTGIDLSADMLAVAKHKLGNRVRLLTQRYDQPLAATAGFDVIVFSYALSMFNPGWETALKSAAKDLQPGGHLACVDFHTTTSRLFARWMAFNHVQMGGHISRALQADFHTDDLRLHNAYGKLWQYLLFIGQPRH
ncbi:MAG: class I SAM-dependent methyltransferase [Gammaproteobacteria bacterium]